MTEYPGIALFGVLMVYSQLVFLWASFTKLRTKCGLWWLVAIVTTIGMSVIIL